MREVREDEIGSMQNERLNEKGDLSSSDTTEKPGPVVLKLQSVRITWKAC